MFSNDSDLDDDSRFSNNGEASQSITDTSERSWLSNRSGSPSSKRASSRGFNSASDMGRTASAEHSHFDHSSTGYASSDIQSLFGETEDPTNGADASQRDESGLWTVGEGRKVYEEIQEAWNDSTPWGVCLKRVNRRLDREAELGKRGQTNARVPSSRLESGR